MKKSLKFGDEAGIIAIVDEEVSDQAASGAEGSPSASTGLLLGEGHVCEHVLLGSVHAGAKLRPSGAELVGDVTPGLGSGGMIGLEEDLPDRGGNDGVLALRHVRQRVAHEVDTAALPGGADDACDGGLQTLVGVGDHQLHAFEAPPDEVAQESRPEGFGLARADGASR